MANQQESTFEVHQLQSFIEKEARRTLFSRVVLLGVICGMLAANVWMTRQAHNDMLTYVDQARLARVALAAQSDARLSSLHAEMTELRRQHSEVTELHRQLSAVQEHRDVRNALASR
jgi:hypothetical protein